MVYIPNEEVRETHPGKHIFGVFFAIFALFCLFFCLFCFVNVCIPNEEVCETHPGKLFFWRFSPFRLFWPFLVFLLFVPWSTFQTLLTAEDIWFDFRPFSKYLRVPFLRPRSNNLEIQNDKNSKWKLVKTRWNPNFGLSDLENDLLTSTTSEGVQWIFADALISKTTSKPKTMKILNEN